MKWQLFIYTKLNLENASSKVISDHTGVLSSDPFLSYLDEKAVKYLVTNKVPEILSALGINPALVILTNLKAVPAFITNKFMHKHFTFADIPLNGEISSLLKKISTEAIINLLEYVYATDQHQVLTKYNIEAILAESIAFEKKAEIKELLNEIDSTLQTVPEIDSVLQLAKLWGKLIHLSIKHNENDYKNLIESVDRFAKDFILSGKMEQVSFASTPKNPKSVDKILANIKADSADKIALVCFDCMGYAEWYLLQEFLQETGFVFTDTALFAMLPSVTAISRSAIFHGSREVYNIKTPGRADESKAFTHFFEQKNTKYFTEQDNITNDMLLGYDCISILYTFFDDLCHSVRFPPNESSKALYFDAVKSYLHKSNILQTLHTLQNNCFVMYFCSDHGSIIAFGNGQKLDKYLIGSFAKRAVVIAAESSDLVQNEKIKIPFENDKIIALPEGRSMFAFKNQVEINHGGITVEEMVVPYIKIKR